MSPAFQLEDYEPVEDRLDKFWKQHPENGAVITELVHHDGQDYIVKATLYVDGRVLATGFAQETVGSSPVNRTSALENCETSAIGRALANCNYAAKGKRPSREEMTKAQAGGGPRPQSQSSPVRPAGGGSPRLATEKQQQMIKRLVEEKQELPSCGWPPPEGFTSREASAVIDEMMALPPAFPKAERKATLRTEPPPEAVVEYPPGEEPF